MPSLSCSWCKRASPIPRLGSTIHQLLRAYPFLVPARICTFSPCGRDDCFFRGGYQKIFLYSILPYVLNLILILSYPKELNRSSEGSDQKLRPAMGPENHTQFGSSYGLPEGSKGLYSNCDGEPVTDHSDHDPSGSWEEKRNCDRGAMTTSRKKQLFSYQFVLIFLMFKSKTNTIQECYKEVRPSGRMKWMDCPLWSIWSMNWSTAGTINSSPL